MPSLVEYVVMDDDKDTTIPTAITTTTILTTTTTAPATTESTLLVSPPLSLLPVPVVVRTPNHQTKKNDNSTSSSSRSTTTSNNNNNNIDDNDNNAMMMVKVIEAPVTTHQAVVATTTTTTTVTQPSSSVSVSSIRTKHTTASTTTTPSTTTKNTTNKKSRSSNTDGRRQSTLASFFGKPITTSSTTTTSTSSTTKSKTSSSTSTTSVSIPVPVATTTTNTTNTKNNNNSTTTTKIKPAVSSSSSSSASKQQQQRQQQRELLIRNIVIGTTSAASRRRTTTRTTPVPIRPVVRCPTPDTPVPPVGTTTTTSSNNNSGNNETTMVLVEPPPPPADNEPPNVAVVAPPLVVVCAAEENHTTVIRDDPSKHPTKPKPPPPRRTKKTISTDPPSTSTSSNTTSSSSNTNTPAAKQRMKPPHVRVSLSPVAAAAVVVLPVSTLSPSSTTTTTTTIGGGKQQSQPTTTTTMLKSSSPHQPPPPVVVVTDRSPTIIRPTTMTEMDNPTKKRRTTPVVRSRSAVTKKQRIATATTTTSPPSSGSSVVILPPSQQTPTAVEALNQEERTSLHDTNIPGAKKSSSDEPTNVDDVVGIGVPVGRTEVDSLHPSSTTTTTTLPPTNDNAPDELDTTATTTTTTKIQSLRTKYQQRIRDTIEQCHSNNNNSDGSKNMLPEEQALQSSLDAFRRQNHGVGAVTIRELSPTTTTTSFPDYAIQSLVHIVEGQAMTLSELVTTATNLLNRQYGRTTTTTTAGMMNVEDNDVEPGAAVFTEDIVSAKVQLLATRNHMLQSTLTSMSKSSTTNAWNHDQVSAVTILSLLEQDHMYRWEIVTPADSLLVFFPDVTCRTNVKKARAARKKISTYCTTLIKLISLLSDIESQVTSPGTNGGNKDDMRAKLWSRFHMEEEKIFKMDREYEAHRIAEMARVEKQEQDRTNRELQQQKKVEAALMRQKEKELKQQQVLQAKAEAAVQQKVVKAEKLSAANTDKREERKGSTATSKHATVKQKQCMMSFLSKRSSSTPIRTPQSESLGVVTDVNEQSPTGTLPAASGIIRGRFDDDDDKVQERLSSDHPMDAIKFSFYEKPFDSDTFRNGLTSSASAVLTESFAHSNLTDCAKKSRQRRKRIRVPVVVTVYPSNDFNCDNPFALPHQQPYSEQVYITIRNRYKFLSFYEDVRPPYFGTWGKESQVITGKNPLGVDTSHLDYDVDSEGEWEEEEDEIGEEIGDDAMEDDEEKNDDDDEDDEDDGWLAADDEIDDDDDENSEKEATSLDKDASKERKTKAGSSSKRESSSVCIISPYQGRPLSKHDIDLQIGKDRIDGIRPSDAVNFLEGFVAVRLNDSIPCLDAFPPPLVDEFDMSNDPQASEKSQLMSDECMKIFAKFVHSCTFGSKEKLIDELLQAHPTVTNTRAHAYRVLDLIADKKKHPCDGSFFWEVKTDVLDNLGLADAAKCIEVDDVKQEAMKVIVRCVHNSTLASREKIVDEIRSCHEHVTASRAEAMRIVQSIATKAKHPNGGYHWIVNEKVLTELGMTSLLSASPVGGIAKVQDGNKIDTNQTILTGVICKKRKTDSSVTNEPNTTVLSRIAPGFECPQAANGIFNTTNILPSRKKNKSVDNNAIK